MAQTPDIRHCYECDIGWSSISDTEFVVLCPLHAAAPQLLEALEDALAVLKDIDEKGKYGCRHTIGILTAAIRAAKGE